MNNCLVTKLPGKVTDTSLLKVGDMKFHIVLNEGERNISIYFHLTADSSIPNNTKGFVLQLSGAEGWMEQTSECYIESGRLCFSFSLPYNAVAPASCMEEVHGTTTEYPVIRILTDNANCPYKWAQQLIFDSVEIKLSLIHI